MSYTILLVWMLTKHFIADFLLQSDIQIREKGSFRLLGGYAHALTHGGLTSAIFLFSSAHIETAFLAGLVDAVIHYLLDWSKANLTMKFELNASQKIYWYLFGLDQWCHVMTTVGIVYYLQ